MSDGIWVERSLIVEDALDGRFLASTCKPLNEDVVAPGRHHEAELDRFDRALLADDLERRIDLFRRFECEPIERATVAQLVGGELGHIGR